MTAQTISSEELNDRRQAFVARGRALFPDWDRVAAKGALPSAKWPLTFEQMMQFLMHPDGPRICYHQMVRVCHGLEP